ncbi:MAG: hypothetical protein ACI93G_000301, partial [Hyphomonas sp.]
MKWFVRSLVGAICLVVLAVLGFQLFKTQIAEIAFKKAI